MFEVILFMIAVLLSFACGAYMGYNKRDRESETDTTFFYLD